MVFLAVYNYFMIQKEIKKFTLIINTVILVLVFALAGLFYLVGASFLIWFSIPTALVYIVGFYLISKNKLDVYVRLVYGWLTLYMPCTPCRRLWGSWKDCRGGIRSRTRGRPS